MHVFVDFQAVKRAVGTKLGVSEWVVVSQERIERCAEATGDVDAVRARRQLPGGEPRRTDC